MATKSEVMATEASGQDKNAFATTKINVHKHSTQSESQQDEALTLGVINYSGQVG